jgi:diguanylate cyclase (GGDEF)-like protein
MTPQRDSGGLKLGLAIRVAVIACATAVSVTLAQWLITPILVKHRLEDLRAEYAANAAPRLASFTATRIGGGRREDVDEMVGVIAGPMIGSEAAVIDTAGRLVVGSRNATELFNSFPGEGLALSEAGVRRRLDGAIVATAPVMVDGEVRAHAVVGFLPRVLFEAWVEILLYASLVLALSILVVAPFLLPLARRALSPVARLATAIRQRSASDRTALADTVDDAFLKPLLAAIDDVHARSDASMKRALAIAYTDPLTRLPNRARFMAVLDRAVTEPAGAVLVVADVDNFRKVNALLGPRLADEALAQIAARLGDAAQAEGGARLLVGRLGADQFAACASGVDDALVEGFLRRASDAMAAPLFIDGQTLLITLSFGVARAPVDAAAPAELLKRAELALREAKRPGASPRWTFFHSGILESARARTRLEAELRRGVEAGEFVAVFQPKVKLSTGELVGAEALARWRRPDGGVVSPGVFVPLAEELGLISQLSAAVLRDACVAAAGWSGRGHDCHVAVNISPLQFSDAGFIDSVYQALDSSGLSPARLELEITESAAVADPDRVARIMWPLRARGVRLAIDDFGTGHSNFAALTRLPFDVFKIDQQFIRALATDPHAPAIVEMILAMAEAMGQETVAEGVETREQADFLLRRNCTVGQGYFFSPPLPAEEFVAFLSLWRPETLQREAA